MQITVKLPRENVRAGLLRFAYVSYRPNEASCEAKDRPCKLRDQRQKRLREECAAYVALLSIGACRYAIVNSSTDGRGSR